MTRGRMVIGGVSLLAAAAIGVLMVRSRHGAAGALGTPKERLSYAMGVAMAKQIHRPEVEIDLDALQKGMRHELTGQRILMSDEEQAAAMTAFQEDFTRKQAESLKTVAERNSKEGKAFLARKAKEPGVLSFPSGLQYKVLAAGTGKQPSASDTVECQYRGTHIDGTEFDASHGRAVTFPVAGLIPGWKEAIEHMPVGSKWQLFVPPELGYGERGISSRKGGVKTIGPSETLVFELELLAVR